MGLLPPVIATLLADTKEYTAKMTAAQGSMAKLGAESMTTGQKMSAFANKATTAIAGLGVAMVGYGIDSALKYQKAIDQIGFQSNASQAEVARLGKQVIAVSNQTASSALDVASAYLAVEQAGYRGAKADAAVTAAGKAAAITGGNIVDVTKAIVEVMKLHVAGNMNATQVTSMLVAANKNHIGSIQDLTALMAGRAGAAAAGYHINLQSILSVFGAMTKSGLSATTAQTALTMGMSKMMLPSTSVQKKLAEIHITQGQLAHTLQSPGGLISGLQLLKSKMELAGIPTKQMGTYLASLTGSRGGAAFAAMLNLLPEAARNMDGLSNATGTFAKSWQDIQKTPSFKLDKLKTQLHNALTQLGLVALPIVVKGADLVTQLLSNKTAMSNFGIALAAVFAGSMAAKAVTIGSKIAMVFGADAMSAGIAPLVGAAIAAGILISMKGSQPQNDYVKAAAEMRKNKLGGAYDISALTLNTFAKFLTKYLPGNPAIPNLPIISGVPSTSVKGFPSSVGAGASRFLPGTVKIKVKP